MAYRVYVSDGLYATTKVYKQRYMEFIKIAQTQSDETADEIVAKVMENGGLQFGE